MGLRKRLRYRFGNWMARGTGAQMALLALVTGVLVIATTIAIVALGAAPVNDKGAPGPHRLRVVTRRGNPMSPSELPLVAPAAAKAVIVLAPEHDASGAPLAAHESDTVVIKTLLALVKAVAAARAW